MKKIAEEVVSNSFWNLLATILSKLGGLIFVMIIARVLLPAKFGIYSLAISIAMIFLSLTIGGVVQALSIYVSEALGKNKKKTAAAYYHYLLNIQNKFSLISAALLILCAYPLSAFVFKKPELLFPLILSAFYLLAFYRQDFYEFLFFAIKKVKYIFKKEMILQASKIAFVLILFLLLSETYHILSVVLALILASLTTIIFLHSALKKTVPFILEKSEEKIDKKRVSNLLTNLIFSDISTTALGYVDVILLGILLTSEYVGFYSAAFAIIAGLFSLIAIPNILLPVFAQVKEKELSNLFGKVFRYTAILAVPIIFGVAVWGKYLLRAIYGYEYLPAILPLIFLSILVLEYPLTGGLKSLLFSRERARAVFKINIIAVFLNFFLSFTLISVLLKLSMIWAMAGAAIATSISRVFVFIALSINARKELNLHYSPQSIIKPIIAGAVMASAILLVHSFIKEVSLASGILEILLGAVIYFAMLLLLKTLKKEDYLLFKLIKSKFRA